MAPSTACGSRKNAGLCFARGLLGACFSSSSKPTLRQVDAYWASCFPGSWCSQHWPHPIYQVRTLRPGEADSCRWLEGSGAAVCSHVWLTQSPCSRCPHARSCPFMMCPRSEVRTSPSPPRQWRNTQGIPRTSDSVNLERHLECP